MQRQDCDPSRRKIVVGQGQEAAGYRSNTPDDCTYQGHSVFVPWIPCQHGEYVHSTYVLVHKVAPFEFWEANYGSTEFAYFYWYSLVRSVYIARVIRAKSATPVLSTATELVLGALSAALAQLFTTPVGVIATRQQVGPAQHEGGDDSFIGLIKDIFRKDGITGFWRGLRPSLVLTVNPAITYGLYERVKNVILAASGGQMTPGKSFVIGALSKSLATVVTFPYILSKTRLQTMSTPHSTAFDVLSHIYKQKGPIGWYQGMNAQITKAVLSQALLFYFRDYFEMWTRQLLLLSNTKATA